MKKVITAGLVVIVGIIIVAIVLVAIIGVREGIGRPVLYVLPDGYRGWVAVFYANPKCPPLSSSGLFLVVTVSGVGHACTSDSASTGWVYHRATYRKSALSDAPPIRAISYSDQKSRDLLFVGSEEELRSSWGAAPW